MNQIEDLVRLRYRGSEGWLTLDEVADGPGFRAGRRLDLVAVGCWDSNAGHLIGFEVKRTVGDWRRELDQPGKRQAFVDEVNEFVFVAPWKVIDPKEVPEGCGLLSLNESGDLRMRVRAKQAKQSPSPAFVTALFRAALRQVMDHEREVHHFAEFRGRSLSFEDLRVLANKARSRNVERDRREEAEHEERRKQRCEQTRQWGDLLDDLYRLGVQLSGDRWGSDNKVPYYVGAVRRGIDFVRARNENSDAAIAQQLRSIADRLAPIAAGATA